MGSGGLLRYEGASWLPLGEAQTGEERKVGQPWTLHIDLRLTGGTTSITIDWEVLGDVFSEIREGLRLRFPPG